METGDFNKNDLDYNDGLGELLTKKQALEFSWSKTIGIVSLLIVFVLIGTHLVFNFGRSFFIESTDVANLGKIPVSNEITEVASQEEVAPQFITPSNETQDAIERIRLDTVSASTYDNDVPIAERITSYKPLTTSQVSLDYKLIIGTFRHKKNALVALKLFKKKGIDSFIRIYTRKDKSRSIKMYQIQAGAFESLTDARTFKNKLAQKNIDGYILKI